MSAANPICLSLILLCACSAADSEPPLGQSFQGVGCDGRSYPSLAETPYVLPYPVGVEYRMNLGNCSSSYHGPDFADRYAYDFDMQIGEIVTASRAGRVVHVKEDGVDGDQSNNNLVVVDHGDDTFGQYMHLTRGGADVSVGDQVVRGDTLGRSGNTGLAGYPHLHFVVTSGGYAYPYDSSPMSFGNASPSHLTLIQGQRYQAKPYADR